MLVKRFAVVGALLLSVGFAQAEDLSVKVEFKDGVMTPQKLEVPAGKPFVIEVSNTGKSAAEFESKTLKQEKVVAPGKTVKLKVKAVKAGEYKFVDEFHENLPTAQGVIIAK